MSKHSIQSLRKWGKQSLTSLPDGAEEADYLLLFCLKKTRAYLYSHEEEICSMETIHQYESSIHKRLLGHPIAYITHEQAFYDLTFYVTEDTLIPRSDTACIIDYVLSHFDTTPRRCLDLGTGAGTLGLTLHYHRQHWSCVLTDMSPKALAIAQKNATHFALSSIQFILSNWFSALANQTFDIIVTNPPYIAENCPFIDNAVKLFEPHEALFSQKNGLADIEHIIENAPDYLNENGLLLIEHGFQQSNQVRTLFEKNKFQAIFHLNDLSGHCRATGGYTKDTWKC